MSFSQKTAAQRQYGKLMTVTPKCLKERRGAPKKQRQVLALGKDKPDPPQAAIVITVFFLKTEMQLR